MVRWYDVEPSNGGLISAAASVSDGFRQIMVDKIVAITYLKMHFWLCTECDPDNKVFCSKAKNLFTEIDERFSSYAGFLKATSDFQKMYETFGPIQDDE